MRSEYVCGHCGSYGHNSRTCTNPKLEVHVRPVRGRSPAVCHPDRPNKSRGLCKQCRDAEYRASARGRQQRLEQGRRRRAAAPNLICTCGADTGSPTRKRCSTCIDVHRTPGVCGCGVTLPRRNRRKCDACVIQLQTPKTGARSRRRHVYTRADKAEVCARLWVEQAGQCAMCGTTKPGLASSSLFDGLVLDHDHETGAPRTLLCRRCNLAVGHVHEDPTVVEQLAGYVAKCRQWREEPRQLSM